MIHQDRIPTAASEYIDRRLALAPVRLGSEFGKKVKSGILIKLPITQQELGAIISTTLGTVSCILSQGDDPGYTICGREQIITPFPCAPIQIIVGSQPFLEGD